MNDLNLIEKETTQDHSETINSDSPSLKRLLDVISSIIAEEYITIAKQNPAVFTDCTPIPNPPHKGEGTK